MMTYLLQVSTCWIVFYFIYMLFLQKETFFTINRYYLLGALLVGLIVPFIAGFLPVNQASTDIYHVINQVTEIEIVPHLEQDASIINWLNILYFIYALGALIVFSRFVYGLYRIYTFFKGSSKTVYENYTLIESTKYHLPFSFFHFIFISKAMPLQKDVEKILRHEELHAHQWHSLDIIITELLHVFFWFNPILIFYKNALRQSHEFLADAYVTKDHNRSSYGQLLLRQSTSGLEIALANHFFHSQIKNRITMMYKEKSKRPAMVKYLMAIPVLAAMLFIFSSSQLEADHLKDEFIEGSDELFKVKNSEINPYEDQGDPIFKVVEEMPRFPGCEDSNESTKEKEQCAKQKMLEFIYQKLTYPSKAKDANIEGMCVVQFVVEKDGSISEGEIVRNIGGGCGEISLVVVNSMPTWIPGKQKGEPVRVQYTLPVKFKLEGEVPKDEKKNVFIISGETKNVASNEINLGPTIPEGSVTVSAGNTTLIEGSDFKIDYTSGKLRIINNSYLQQNVPIQVSFGHNVDNTKTGNLLIQNQQKLETNSESDKLFKVVEEMPRFPGCEDSNDSTEEKEQCAKQKMLEFIYTNIKYPKEAKAKGIDGVAIVQLTIEKDGSITNSKILRDPGAGTGTEAKRVIDLMPNWIPGKQGGNLVRVQYVLPIKYKLDGDDKPNEVNAATMEKLEVRELNISPNPSNGIFTLVFDLEDKSPADVRFYSKFGETLKSLNSVDVPFTNTIDLTEFKGQTIYMSILQKDKIYNDQIVVY